MSESTNLGSATNAQTPHHETSGTRSRDERPRQARPWSELASAFLEIGPDLAQAARRAIGHRLFGWMRSERKVKRSAVLSIGLAIAGPILALLTYATLSSGEAAALNSLWFRGLILSDIIYLLAVFALIGMQVARLVIARRAHTAGSKLHGRMVAVFTVVAAAPAMIVAVFFFLVIQLSFNDWFSDQVGSVVRNSREIARAYSEEHRQAIGSQAIALASALSAAAPDLVTGPSSSRFRAILEESANSSIFSDIYILNSSGDIVARGPNSFLFSFTPPSLDDMAQAQGGQLVIHEDREANEMRALVRLNALFDAFLYVSRPVDGEVLSSLERTNRGVQLYNRLESNRDTWMARFAALYLGFAVLVLTAAIYLGLWFAERLSKPIGRLAAAAQRIRSGDLFVRVKEERGDDEIALLSRVFNRMTEEVERKQDALTAANFESEQRRLFSEAVLSGVTAGVIGLDAEGHVRLLNRSAAALLDLDPVEAAGQSFNDVAPEFAGMLEDAKLDPAKGVEKSIRITRGEEERELLARITSQREEHGRRKDGKTAAVSGYVVTLDDLTELVSAQRMAAWGDVARRVAHEIKNPLTPIQLAAERMRRKYNERLGDDAESFDRYIETIVRQTADIGRMVDAFVRFAKLPTPNMANEPLQPLVQEAVLLQKEAQTHIAFSVEAPEEPILVRCDRGQVLQALTNLLKNAGESIEARLEQDRAGDIEAVAPPEIRVAVAPGEARTAVISISDNGVGLPTKDRRRLLEPYVTTREKGTGLGLAIVLKIVEEHGGYFDLAEAEPFAPDARRGACARITLPLAAEKTTARTPRADYAEVAE